MIARKRIKNLLYHLLMTGGQESKPFNVDIGQGQDYKDLHLMRISRYSSIGLMTISLGQESTKGLMIGIA